MLSAPLYDSILPTPCAVQHACLRFLRCALVRRGPSTASSDIASSEVSDGVVIRLVPAVDGALGPDTVGDACSSKIHHTITRRQAEGKRWYWCVLSVTTKKYTQRRSRWMIGRGKKVVPSVEAEEAAAARLAAAAGAVSATAVAVLPRQSWPRA